MARTVRPSASANPDRFRPAEGVIYIYPLSGRVFLFTRYGSTITFGDTMMLAFAKYQALGNSFIVLDKIEARGRRSRFETLARRLCDRAYGLGADGLLVLSRPKNEFRVDIYNADGSWAEKSGNGVRIAATHLRNKRQLSGKTAELLTGSGMSQITLHSGDRLRRIVSATLGRPEFDAARIPAKSPGTYFINRPIKLDGRSVIASAVSVGNPHLILFCRSFEFDWETVGAQLEVAPQFPRRINVGFVVVKNKTSIEVRDWERGVGPTGSSGTGAAAAVAVAVLRGLTSRTVNVHCPAGVLTVTWEKTSDQLSIKGPVEFICAGKFEDVRRASR
jgi:diaminopimelate epimerase